MHIFVLGAHASATHLQTPGVLSQCEPIVQRTVSGGHASATHAQTPGVPS